MVMDGFICARIVQTLDSRNVFEWNSEKREVNWTRNNHVRRYNQILCHILDAKSIRKMKIEIGFVVVPIIDHAHRPELSH
jgi:hypothetical protein